MRVMVLTDASFAHREHQLLTRLEIGLADDGAAILHAVPLRCSADIVNAFSSTLVRYDDSPSPLWRHSRARQLLAAAREVLDVSELQVDIVHVFGRSAWALAEALARETKAALVFEAWRADLIDDALLHARRHSSAGGGRAGILTSSERIEEIVRGAARRDAAKSRVCTGLASWGVPTSESTRPPIEPSRAIAISVVAEGRTGGDLAELRALLEGIQRATRRFDNLLVFLDGAAADRAPVWRAARRLKLLDRVTAVAEMEARREPILQTDILILPEPNGVCRTLPLAAMAEGVAVIARPDPFLASWLNDRTARLVGAAAGEAAGRPATPEDWERAIISCIENEADTSSRRLAARSLVREDRTVTAYVEGVRRLYDGVLNADVAAVAVGA